MSSDGPEAYETGNLANLRFASGCGTYFLSGVSW
jgi:hypothetical protein